ncbi:hypothetical protein OQH23_14280, partial [Acinetobacter baumannii]|nr:hypothetical protein [Acinetobacter baumannii]
MNDLITRYLNNLGQWHEVALTMTKAIIAIGVLCLVAYLLTISYIPDPSQIIRQRFPLNFSNILFQ